jgi:hypothetical protein
MDAFKTLVGGQYLGVVKDEQNEQLLSMAIFSSLLFTSRFVNFFAIRVTSEAKQIENYGGYRG